MNLLPRYWALAFGVCLGWSAIAVAEDASQEKPASSEPLAASAADLEFFETKIRPILASRCQQCHGSEQQKGGLRLDSRAALTAGGESGPEVVPGKPAESRLIDAVRYENPDLQMPPKGKLPAGEIAALTSWVASGAVWPATDKAAAGAAAKTAAAGPSANAKEAFNLAARKARHWCWQPIRAVAPPTVMNLAWPRQPLDRFVLARLEASGLAPAGSADRRTLIRRATFDITGLPPTPAEVEAFIHDTGPTAWETVLDRLLASPHFGERWARHWMDLVRYGETRGHEFDYESGQVYQYRDYLIRAFNADVPYDQFVTEHIAGDLMPQPRIDAARQRNESVLGTGFWFLGEWIHSPVDIRLDETDRVDNQIDVMCKTFLGLTVACARCHDHKFDAISTRDYYSLAGYLHSSTYRETAFEWRQHNREVADKLDEQQVAAGNKVLERMAMAARPVLERLDDYLLATRELALAGTAEAGEAETRASRLQACQTLAAARGLNGDVLAQWWDELAKAGKDPLHPLYCWANAAGDAKADSPDRVAALLRAASERWQREHERAREERPAQSIVDYAQLQPGQWFSDGLAFGSGPLAARRVRIGTAAEQPILTIADPPVAGTLSRGPELRSMLRTPTFTIGANSIFFRTRGGAEVLVVVDSHRMIAGPLHGNLKLHVKSDGWQWHKVDVSRYPGERAHLEFRTANDAKELSVAACVQADQAPVEPSRIFESLEQAIFSGVETAPIELAELASRYQHAFTEACAAAASGTALADAAPEQARLAQWCLQHPGMFGYGGAAQEDVAALLHEQAQERAALTAQIKSSATAVALVDQNGVNEHVLLRGSPKTPGPETARRYLEALGGADQPPIASGSGRLELARQMVEPRGPLTSRVMVNRVWHHLFGRGIVASVDNFGVLGEEPSHPELLDYLANEFVGDGWSLKRLIRRLMLSSSYQMSSHPDGAGDKADPLNLLLHRANLRRLEGEAIRDALLLVSGRLDNKLYGPSVDVFLTPFMEGRGRPASGPLDGAGRRSVYTKIRRNFLPPMMMAFDMPSPFSTMGRRTVSNVPAQPLILLNDPFVVLMAQLWAERTLASVDRSAADRIRAMYLDGFSREPTDAELAAALTFVAEEDELLTLPADRRPHDKKLWADFAHVLINTKEFIFIP